MKNFPVKISSYGSYSSQGYGAHTRLVSLAGLSVYFSYDTPVAFRTSDTGLVVRENDWGPTTSKHLRWIDGGNKKQRIPGEEFERQLQEVIDLMQGEIASVESRFEQKLKRRKLKLDTAA